MVIKRIGVLKLAMFQAVLLAFFGLLAALFIAAFGGLVGNLSQDAGVAGMMFGAGLAMFIVLPIVYGILGFISGAIGALLYNLVASFMGGVELDVE